MNLIMKSIQRLSLFIFLIFLVGQAWGQPRNQAAALDKLFTSMTWFNGSDRFHEIYEYKKEGVTLIKVNKEKFNSFGQPSKVLLYGDHYLIPVPTSYMEVAMSEGEGIGAPRSIRYLVSQSEKLIESAKGWESITLQGHSSHFIRNPEGDSFILKFTRYNHSQNIEKSLANSERLEEIKMSKMYSWLPEYAGLSLDDMREYFGLILRDIKPIQHQLKKGHEVIPLNVLWGYSKKEAKSLLKHYGNKNSEDLIIPPQVKGQAKKAGLPPMEWILNEYIKPLGEFTAEQNFLDKVQGGNHKQNLLAVYKKGRFQKFIAYDAYDLSFSDKSIFAEKIRSRNLYLNLLDYQIRHLQGYTGQAIFGEVFWPLYINTQMMKEFMTIYLKHVQKLTDIDTSRYLKIVENKFSNFEKSQSKDTAQKSNKQIRDVFRMAKALFSKEHGIVVSKYEDVGHKAHGLLWSSPIQISEDVLKSLFNQKEVNELLFSKEIDQQISCSRLFQ